MPPLKQPGRVEFIALAALLMSTAAMSIDFVLPALGILVNDIGGADGNQRQWTVTTLFIGLAFGQLFFGPFSDVAGRRPAALIGITLFGLGSIICTYAPTYEIFLLGRLIQGFGVAGPRIATVAMVRDRFKGVDMAKIMSIVIGIFIFVPILAPISGQVLLYVMPWEGLFIVNALICAIGGVWLFYRQPETLIKSGSASVPFIRYAFLEVINNRRAIYLTCAGACVFGPLMGFVNSSQQIFQDLYSQGDAYALLFGASAIFASTATFANSKLVSFIPMWTICTFSMVSVSALGAVFIGILIINPHPPLWLWMVFSCPIVFLVALTFGNINSMALEPLGHVAGVASALTATIHTLLGLIIAALIGLSFNSTLMPVSIGYCLFSAIGVFFMVIAKRREAALA